MLKRSGFTLIELLVVIAIIAILAAILFPVFMQAKSRGQQTKCVSHTRQIGTAIMSYSDDYGGALPYAFNQTNWSIWWEGTFRERLRPHLKSKGVLMCPVRTAVRESWDPRPISQISHYGINYYLVCETSKWGFCYLSEIKRPTRTILISENFDGDWSAEPWDNASTGHEGQFYPYHGDAQARGGNFVFGDGHAKFMSEMETERNGFELWRNERY